MSASEDPFPQVQQEVRAAWGALNVSNLSPNDRESRLEALELDVHDLRTALDIARADPVRFRLSGPELAARARFVDDMTTAIAHLRARLAASALHGKADGGAPVGGDGSARGANDAFIGDELLAQETVVRRQDEELDALASAVQRIGNLGRDMHSELEQQGELIEDLGGNFGGALERMKSARVRLQTFMDETGPRQFCTIIWLSVAFIVLTMLVVLT